MLAILLSLKFRGRGTLIDHPHQHELVAGASKQFGVRRVPVQLLQGFFLDAVLQVAVELVAAVLSVAGGASRPPERQSRIRRRASRG